MNGTLRALLSAIGLAIAAPAAAQAMEPYVVPAFDVALDPRAFAGKTVRIRGCLFRGVLVDGALCEVVRGSTPVGWIPISHDRDDVDGRRRLIETCASPLAPRYRCSPEIVAEVRVDAEGRPTFANTLVLW